MEWWRTQKRCVNLDWLEVHAREPKGEPHTIEYFQNCGYYVEDRGYGTRVYREMFTLCDDNGLKCIEIRRNPSSSGLNGIHDEEETHIRLVNRLLYCDNAAQIMIDFLTKHHYEDVRISRVDICLDFVRFDYGDDPERFVKRYLKHKYAKINQGNICAHGSDDWEGQTWNSLKWGTPISIVSTKMYNKTQELKETSSQKFAKPYIRQAWLLCGFIDDMDNVTLDGKEVNVWRVEFSVKSSQRRWAPIEIDGKPNHKYSLRNTLDCYTDRGKLITIFASLAQHYFHFKKYKHGVRKDRCEDKKLFNFSDLQTVYKLAQEYAVCGEGDKVAKRFNRLLQLLEEYDMTHYSGDAKQAAQTLISALKDDMLKADMARPWSTEELVTMRAMVVGKMIKKQFPQYIIKRVMEETLKISPSAQKYFDGIVPNEGEP